MVCGVSQGHTEELALVSVADGFWEGLVSGKDSDQDYVLRRCPSFYHSHGSRKKEVLRERKVLPPAGSWPVSRLSKDW